jgi:hypothetical protein
MDKKINWIILAILVILLSISIFSFFKYSYHERDESYAYVNGIYIKCHPVENGTECLLPDGKVLTLKLVKTFVSVIK